MKQASITLAALLLAPLAALHAALPKAANKPNIVYLLADQWRSSATGYAGDPNAKTPQLDRLAKEGLNFRNTVSVCPVCTPYRAALMTGRYPTSTGMFLNDAHLPDSELCLAEVLQSAGYATAYIGKWHLDGHGRTSYIPPERRQGWDYWKAAECDHTYNHSHYYTGNSDVRRFWEGYDAFAQTKDGQQYIRDHAHGPQPFVLLISYGVPHFPHATAPDEYQALYPPEKIKLPPNVPPAMQAQARREAQGYYAHCTALDKCVGDVLQTLEETGIANNTILVFTSDHGEMLGSHGCPPMMKQVAWNESAHVPFLLRYPAIHGRQGRVVNTPLTTPDIFPTLLGLAGVKVPRTVEGDDLSLLIRNGREESERVALYMGVAPFIAREFAEEYRAIRTSRYTYVRGLDGPWRLFDDEQDPYQMDNLAAKPECAALCQKLDERLQERLKKINDPFRPGRSYIAEWGYEIAPHGSVPYSAKELKPQTPKYRPPAGVVATGEPSAFIAPGVKAGPDKFNYVIGTQTFRPSYQFTKASRLVETAEAILALGCTVIKFELAPRYARDHGNVPAPMPALRSLADLARDEPSHRQVLDMPFVYYVLWAHTFSGGEDKWRKGFAKDAAEKEYREMYDLTAHLLKTYSGSGKIFYLGHWEGDGFLRGSVAPENDAKVTPVAVQGMVDWLNTRQRAVDDAKRDTPHERVQVWHYTEVNHVKLAMQGRPALVNEVLPKTTVDLVSYSTYDTQYNPALLKAALNFIESKLPPKAGLTGRRVFIGEYGFPTIRHPPQEQDRLSSAVIQAGLEWGCPLVLYWELYNNEVDPDGQQRGFWLIDDKGAKQPVYETHRRFLQQARQLVTDRLAKTSRPPTFDEFRRAAVAFLDPAPHKTSGIQPAGLELRQAAFEAARPSISNLLAVTERQLGMKIVFIALPDDDPVAARFIFDPFRNEPQVQLRQNWQDVDVAHELMHARMDLIDGFSMLAWRRDVPHTPEVEAAFARVQTYVKDEVVHANLAKMGLRIDGEIIRPTLFDSVYANAARYLEEGRGRPNDGMAHLDKLGRGSLCRVCFLVQAELLLKNYRARLPQSRIEQTERFIRAFRARRPEESEKADDILALFRKHDVQTPAKNREILAAWAKMEGLENFVGPSSFRKNPDDRYILPFPELQKKP